MREFYVYGFRSRGEYNKKSARSYDDERRRIESWLGEYMRFKQTPDGKNYFLSVDSRVVSENPFYKAWKAKSFTDGDITLHFAVFDILWSPEIKKTLAELTDEIDALLASSFDFDESTLRKKLKEYAGEGIIRIDKQGRQVLYSRSPDTDISGLCDVIDLFSEVAPCGVIGSFLRDKQPKHESMFHFKHHYITQAIDSDIMAELFDAIRQKRYVTLDNYSRHSDILRTIRLLPLKIYISAQNGRQYLIAYNESIAGFGSYRLDYISNLRLGELCGDFDLHKTALKQAEAHMWGVTCRSDNHYEHVEFEIRAGADEQFIVRRLEREKRCGKVEKIDDIHYRYTADVFDTTELVPWIRTFISRITRLNFSNRTVENRFRSDIREMYRIYGIDGGDGSAVQ